jgi:hypothetical protein
MSKQDRDLLDQIHRQLSGSESDLRSSGRKSINYHLANIAADLKKWARDRLDDRESRIETTNWTLGILAVIAFALIQLGGHDSTDFKWVQQNKIAIRIWGVVLAAVYIGVSVERSELVKSIWLVSVPKLVASIAASGLIVYSTGKAAGAINGVFGVDASSFPVTLVFTTAIILFHLVAPFLFGLSLAALVHFFNFVGWIKALLNGRTHELPPFHSFMFLMVAAVIMYQGWAWSKNELSIARLPEKIYLMAYKLDFNERHQCGNLKKDVSVVYLGSNQQSVLVTPTNLEDFDFSDFFTASVRVPTEFFKVECEYPDYSLSEKEN